MATVKDIADAIERIAPLSLQEDYDNSGLQVGNPSAVVRRVLVALDVTEDTVAEASERDAQLVVSHHPILFRPLRRITPADYIGRTMALAIRNGVALYAAHTNLDNTAGGVNYRMAAVLGLCDVKPLASLPPSRTHGIPDDMARECGSGVVGTLAAPMAEDNFIALVRERFHSACVKHNRTGRLVQKVALCGGSGGDYIGQATSVGADAFLTGEVGYHPFFGHPELLILEAGHYETEQFTCQLLAEVIDNACPDVDVCITQHPANPIEIN